MVQVPKSVLITGANRGIGLEMVRQLLKLGSSKVIATARDPSKADALQQLVQQHPNQLFVLPLEVTNFDGLNAFADTVKQTLGTGNGLTWLINNAGIYLKATLEQATPADMLRNFEVNAVAPLFIARALLPVLRQSASGGDRTLIINITSRMGSIDDNTSGGFYAYRASKTALNMITRSLAIDLRADNLHATAVHPGWVQTDMGGPDAKLTTESSVSQMFGFLTDEKRQLSGNFYNYDGQEIKW